ncbi:YeiH family protein [Pseudolysobacter antarcticus]|uniref:YeiH family protein n=1 Tax=Pseudolysobacter antarcticus TaxID=2511995 RepID=UPI001F5D53FE|nr:YeiH family protein [Pseudolysobacter antarcticus]
MLPGLILSIVLAIAAISLGKAHLLQTHGISALTLAIVLGMLIGNTFYPAIASDADAGVIFAKQRLLRLGIILYGFRLAFQDIARVGIVGVAIDVLVLGSTFGLAWLLGVKVFKLDRTTALLIGAGSSICGAAAVMATEPVVRGRADQVTVAVSTVVVFGTLAIFIYPALYQLNQTWHFLSAGPTVFGVYVGSTVHEVAQVVAAARSISEETANTAVIAKMVRVMMLAPFLVILSAWLARSRQRNTLAQTDQADAKAANRGVVIPWFALIFVLVAGFNSLALLPASVVATVTDIDTFLLTMAMAALGLTTHLSAIRRAGIKPLLLGALLFFWLIVGGALINLCVQAALR